MFPFIVIAIYFFMDGSGLVGRKEKLIYSVVVALILYLV